MLTLRQGCLVSFASPRKPSGRFHLTSKLASGTYQTSSAPALTDFSRSTRPRYHYERNRRPSKFRLRFPLLGSGVTRGVLFQRTQIERVSPFFPAAPISLPHPFASSPNPTPADPRSHDPTPSSDESPFSAFFQQPSHQRPPVNLD
jgi:hypothetical protein